MVRRQRFFHIVDLINPFVEIGFYEYQMWNVQLHLTLVKWGEEKTRSRTTSSKCWIVFLYTVGTLSHHLGIMALFFSKDIHWHRIQCNIFCLTSIFMDHTLE